jgi:hypothetical protein
MGHYDSSREHDAEQRDKLRLWELNHCLERVVDLQDHLPEDVPARFKDSLEDLRNWLTVELRWDSLLKQDRR